MFISHKSNVIQQISDVEWDCRRLTKGQTKAEYWAWLDSVTTVSGSTEMTKEKTIDYSGETGYTIVECVDEDVSERLAQLNDYRADGVYNIKYYASKRDAEEIKDQDGNSYDPKQYVSSHFVGDDSAKDARIHEEQWAEIRAKRDKLLTETDWMTCSDSPTMSDANKTYRQKLRDLPSDQKDKTTLAGITWPTKPA